MTLRAKCLSRQLLFWGTTVSPCGQLYQLILEWEIREIENQRVFTELVTNKMGRGWILSFVKDGPRFLLFHPWTCPTL